MKVEEYASLIGRTVMVGNKRGTVTQLMRIGGKYAVRLADSVIYLWRDEFCVLPTQEEIAEALHGVEVLDYVSPPAEKSLSGSERGRVAAAVLALLEGSEELRERGLAGSLGQAALEAAFKLLPEEGARNITDAVLAVLAGEQELEGEK